MTLRLNNNKLSAPNTMQVFSGRTVQLDTFNKGQIFQRFDKNCKEMPAKSCMQPLGVSYKKKLYD